LEKSITKTPCKSRVKIQGNIISTFFSIFYRDFAPLFLKVDFAPLFYQDFAPLFLKVDFLKVALHLIKKFT